MFTRKFWNLPKVVVRDKKEFWQNPVELIELLPVYIVTEMRGLVLYAP